MYGTDVLTIDRRGDPGDSIDVTATPVTSRPAWVRARFVPSLSTHGFQMGPMGAGLGWHGFVLDSSPSTQVECTL